MHTKVKAIAELTCGHGGGGHYPGEDPTSGPGKKVGKYCRSSRDLQKLKYSENLVKSQEKCIFRSKSFACLKIS